MRDSKSMRSWGHRGHLRHKCTSDRRGENSLTRVARLREAAGLCSSIPVRPTSSASDGAAPGAEVQYLGEMYGAGRKTSGVGDVLREARPSLANVTMQSGDVVVIERRPGEYESADEIMSRSSLSEEIDADDRHSGGRARFDLSLG